MIDKDIAIVGISVACPAGYSAEQFWQGIVQGGDFITDAPDDIIEAEFYDGIGKDLDRLYCKRGGFNRVFALDPLRYGVLPIMADGMDPDQLLALAGADAALKDADVYKKGISLQNGSIIIGKGNFAGLVALRNIEIVRTANELTAMLKTALPELTEEDLDKVKKAYQKKQGRWQADMAIGTMPNLVASLIANRFDMQGPAYCVDAACASGLVAINHSIELLRNGQCDISLAGGIHSTQSPMFWSAFNLMGAISHKQQISPFNEDADGLLVGQGGGFLVLKTLKKAMEDDDRIYAIIKDTAVCSDGGGSHVTVTSVQGEARVMEMAWKRAGIDPERVGLIEAHGTGTPVGDKTEITALKQFFGDNTHPQAFVGSVKSNIGHAMPAAGMIGVIKTALALYHRRIPPTLHCEKPLAAMFESRFLPPQEAILWDGERYPLVAGVNAFGFGGINSHAVLTAYEPKPGASPIPRPRPYFGEAIMLSAPDKETLIQKLKSGDYSNTGGDYRIVIFGHDNMRIERAISIVENDKPWKGRLDIWFSNSPLLSKGGKIVFLFAGFNPDPELSESDSVSDAFDLPKVTDLMDERRKKNKREFRSVKGAQEYFIQWISMEALKKLGIEADMYAGHSFGEWYATAYAGLAININSEFDSLIDAQEPSNEHPFIAINGVNRERAEEWCRLIPNLYLANDNCPKQILMCGEAEATETLVELLEKEHIFYNIMPFGDIHTPFAQGQLELSLKYFDDTRIYEDSIPVWSATTLERVPTDRDEYKKLVESQLTRPVYFRGLIEKLYEQENARLFIQVGLGPLTNFVEDILENRDFGTIPTCAVSRDGFDQLRRVLALLFVEGREVDPDLLGVNYMYQTDRGLMLLPAGAPYNKEFPELKEVVQNRYGLEGTAGFADFDAGSAKGHPLLQAANENMKEAMKAQGVLTRLFADLSLDGMDAGDEGKYRRRERRSDYAAGAAASSQIGDGKKREETGNASESAIAAGKESFIESLNIILEEHPYLVDHSIIRQPQGWPFLENLNIAVPFTMTMELLSDIAVKHASGKKLIGIRKMMAYQWIVVTDRFEGSVKGIWKEENVLELDLMGYAKGEFVLADEWPEPPSDYSGDIDVGEEILKDVTAAELYERHAFHGPKYQSSTEVIKICSRGMKNLSEKKEGKGSLLDIMGQQLGLFLHLTQTENVISFPIQLKELDFFCDYRDQAGVFEHCLIITRLNDTGITGDMVLKRDGKLWSVARGFVCQRFASERSVWQVSISPNRYHIATEIAPGVFHYSNNTRANVQSLLEKRFLDVEDLKYYSNLETVAQKRSALASRIALKDAIRCHLRNDDEEMVYPVQIFLKHDEKGRPFVIGYAELAERVNSLCVSLAHKDIEGVAMVADHPVGVDIGRIEEKSEEFLEFAFTERERSLLKSLNKQEYVIRFLVAKEACAKKAGVVAEGKHHLYEVEAVQGNILFVGADRVQTSNIGEEYIVGWTL